MRCALSLCVVPALVATATLAAELPNDWVDGSWTGAYFCYPDPIRLDVTLDSTGNSLSGEVRLTTLTTERRAMGMREARHSLNGRLEPRTRSLVLAVDSGTEQARNAVPRGFEGVIDVENEWIGGQLAAGAFNRNGCSSFVLGRGRQAEIILDRVVLTTTARAANLGGFGSRGCDRFVEWAARLETEYPEFAERVYNNREAKLNLFADEHFSSFFETPYSEFNERERGALETQFIRCKQRSPVEFNRFVGLESAFRSIGTFSAPEISVEVLARRAVRNWQTQTTAESTSLAATVASLDSLDAWEAIAKQHLLIIWPSERRRAEQDLAAARRTVAEAATARSLDDVISAGTGRDRAIALARWSSEQARLLQYVSDSRRADYGTRIGEVVEAYLAELAAMDLAAARGYEGARLLGTWNQLNAETLTVASSAFRAEILQRVGARAAVLIAESVRNDAAALPGLGTGYDAVVAGATWYRRFVTRYEFAAQTPDYRSVVAGLQGRRPRDLEAGLREIIARIGGQTSAAGVNAVESLILAVPGDAESSAGRGIARIAEARRDHLLMEAVLGHPVGVEALAACTALASGRAPCEIEVYSAVQQHFSEQINDPLQAFNEYCREGGFKDESDVVASVVNAVGALGCLYNMAATFGQFDTSFQVTALRFLGCTPSQQTSGYNCNMRLVVNTNNQLLQAGIRERHPLYLLLDALQKVGGETVWHFQHSAGLWHYTTQPRP